DASAIVEFLRADQFGQRFDVETLQRPPAGRVAADAPVIVVSGLPRSGTSLMMQMLDAGGVFALTDGVRAADPSNPRGYFEHEKSLRLYEDNRWLAEARNRAVKIVAPLFPLLPQGENYRVVLMRRDIEEVIRSQSKMLVRLGKSAASDAEDLRMVLQQHFDEVSGSCERHGIPVTVVDYSELMADAESVVARLSEFLGGGLQTDRMAGVVDTTLYRERLS
ncbi:MAG: sulfotransferase domain-containing protein, partial [Planctomyces sp.]